MNLEYIYLTLFGIAIISLAAGMLIIALKKDFSGKKGSTEKV